MCYKILIPKHGLCSVQNFGQITLHCILQVTIQHSDTTIRTEWQKPLHKIILRLAMKDRFNFSEFTNIFSLIWHSEDRASGYVLIIKPTRCTISQICFWNRTLHVSHSFSVHEQESSTVHTAIGICHTGYAECLLASSQHNLYVLLCVQC